MKLKVISLWLLVGLLFTSNCTFGGEKLTPEEISGPSSESVSIKFLDIKAGKAAIIDDSLDPYFNKLQAMEMSAKTGSEIAGKTLEEQRQQCRKRYQAGVRGFSEEEREAISRCVKGLYPALEKRYPVFANMPWSFLKVSDSVEGGLSHTRGGHIVFSERTCRRITGRYRTNPERAAMSFGRLLVHEQMHVFQRVNPGFFDSLYTGIWGFIRAKEIESCLWLEKHNLVNPDGTNCCWVFPIKQGEDTIYILPLLIFAEGEGLKRMGRDFRMIAVELDRSDGRFRPKLADGGRPVFRNLFEVPEYREVFPTTGNIYHPNEACASVFAQIVMAESIVPGGAGTEESERELARLRKWFVENLREKRPEK